MPPIYTVTLNPGLDRTLTVPKLHENAVLRATSSRLDWGGKGFNVTRALQALELESIALGMVGGFTGQMLTQGLEQLGITTDFVQIKGESRTNTVIEEMHSGRYIKVNEIGPPVERADLDALRGRILTRVRAGSYWALCGSLPPGADSTFYADLITLIQSQGAFACLDASGEALHRGIESAPFLVKPNAEEAAEYSGIAITGVAACRPCFPCQGRNPGRAVDGCRWVAVGPTRSNRSCPPTSSGCANCGGRWGCTLGRATLCSSPQITLARHGTLGCSGRHRRSHDTWRRGGYVD